MKPIELYEEMKIAANGSYAMNLYFIPVTVGDEKGQLNPVEGINNLVTMGEITEDTTFGVSFEGDEGYYPLSEIEIAGPTQTF